MARMMLVFLIVKVRMCDHAVGMLMAMRRAGGNRRLMGMIVVPVAVGMLMTMCDAVVGVRLRVLVHDDLLGCSRTEKS
jgi:hypothetical protein